MTPAPVELSFDDGPDPVWTPAVLEALRRLGARATFFVLSPQALAHPEVVDAIASDGHEIGLHAWNHVRHGERSRAELEDDTDRALEALARLGVTPRRWRTPWGDTAPWSAAVAAERGLAITGWTADSHDWRGDPAERMLDALVPELGPGGMVLMHDGLGPGALRSDCRETVRLIEPLCTAIRERGWAAGSASLDDVLAVVAAGAAGRDADPPAFPEGPMRLLERAGVLAATVPRGGAAPGPASEWALVRSVARADGSVGADPRRPPQRRRAARRARARSRCAPRSSRRSRAGERRLGVWGADPAPGEGAPAAWPGPPATGASAASRSSARARAASSAPSCRARREPGPPLLAYVDLGAGVAIDRSWYRGAGHARVREPPRRVRRRAACSPCSARPGELSREPWFARDAIRTAACWAGIADRRPTRRSPRSPRAPAGDEDLAALAAGRPARAGATIDRWFAAAAAARGRPRAPTCADLSVHLRAAVAGAAPRRSSTRRRARWARAPLAGGGDLDRCPPRPGALPAPAPPRPARGARRPRRAGAPRVRTRMGAAYFEELYAADHDPWDLATSAYERDKYEATMAALEGRRFASALEVGCSIGMLTERWPPAATACSRSTCRRAAVARARANAVGPRRACASSGAACPRRCRRAPST